MQPAMTELHDDVSALLNRLCDCWTRLSLPEIADLWDRDDPGIFLLPQEIEHPLVGWPALEDYLARAQARLHAASMRVRNLNVRPLAPGMAVALYEMHWNGLIKGMARPMGVDSRATAVFRRRPDGWRICHYVEAPVAFMLHLQQRYHAAVDADFLARIEKERSGGPPAAP
jgi:ketosteroid isomerase-like protein